MEQTSLPTEIRSSRITLRRHSLALANQMFKYVNQDRSRLREFLPWVDSTVSVGDEVTYIQMTLEKWEEGSLFDFGIFRNSDSLYLGNCGVHSIAWEHRRCEIGYWILGAVEGQGFMSEAVRALEDVLFSLGFNRIEIRCSSLNVRSANVPRSNRYLLEGVLRQESLENGKFRDTLIFAKVKEDYLRRGVVGQPLLGLDHTRLSVSDLAASTEWYTKVLGAPPSLSCEGYVEFRVGKGALALAPADEKSPLSTGGQVAYWRVADLDSAVAHFVAEGAKIYRGPLEIEREEAICQILDPFGNAIGLIGRSRRK